jgi:hypothetical protein
MAEIICPVTGELCVARCVEGRCWVKKVAPLIKERVNQAIEIEAETFSNMESIPVKNRARLKEILINFTKKK